MSAPAAPRPTVSAGPRPGLVLRLAWADLWHEWILTLCLILAVSAVIAPLLLLFGLKYGTIETLRHRLIQDPKNRELRPATSATFTRERLAALARLPGAAFLVANTRQLSSGVSVQRKGNERVFGADLVPTADGDPLALENGGLVPGPGECLLTQTLASTNRLGVKAGDTIVVIAGRQPGGRPEQARTELRVAGVLDLRASALDQLYVRLDLLEAVERYRDGQAVPELGWPGGPPRPYPVYNGAVVWAERALSKVEESTLCSGTGYTRIERLEPPRLAEETGLRFASTGLVYRLVSEGGPQDASTLANVRQRLRGRAIVLPWVRPIAAELSGRPVRVVALSAAADDARRSGLQPVPPWGAGEADAGRAPWRVLAPAGAAGPAELSVSNAVSALRLPVETGSDPEAAEGLVYAPAAFAGALNLSGQRSVRFEASSGDLAMSRRGYASFRMYARTIDDVEPLRYRLEADGIPVYTAAEQIRQVKEMDRYLTLIFWLVAIVGIAGSIASLVASLYASVERKRRELGVLRLIGFSGAALHLFPVFQGACLAAGGYLAASAFFATLATVINRLFRSPGLRAGLGADESLCRLPWEHWAAALAAAVLLAAASAILAVWRLSRIDPAEALRDE